MSACTTRGPQPPQPNRQNAHITTMGYVLQNPPIPLERWPPVPGEHDVPHTPQGFTGSSGLDTGARKTMRAFWDDSSDERDWTALPSGGQSYPSPSSSYYPRLFYGPWGGERARVGQPSATIPNFHQTEPSGHVRGGVSHIPAPIPRVPGIPLIGYGRRAQKGKRARRYYYPYSAYFSPSSQHATLLRGHKPRALRKQMRGARRSNHPVSVYSSPLQDRQDSRTVEQHHRGTSAERIQELSDWPTVQEPRSTRRKGSVASSQHRSPSTQSALVQRCRKICAKICQRVEHESKKLQRLSRVGHALPRAEPGQVRSRRRPQRRDRSESHRRRPSSLQQRLESLRFRSRSPLRDTQDILYHGERDTQHTRGPQKAGPGAQRVKTERRSRIDHHNATKRRPPSPQEALRATSRRLHQDWEQEIRAATKSKDQRYGGTGPKQAQKETARTAERDSPCTSCERPSSPWRPCRERSKSPARDIQLKGSRDQHHRATGPRQVQKGTERTPRRDSPCTSFDRSSPRRACRGRSMSPVQENLEEKRGAPLSEEKRDIPLSKTWYIQLQPAKGAESDHEEREGRSRLDETCTSDYRPSSLQELTREVSRSPLRSQEKEDTQRHTQPTRGQQKVGPGVQRAETERRSSRDHPSPDNRRPPSPQEALRAMSRRLHQDWQQEIRAALYPGAKERQQAKIKDQRYGGTGPKQAQKETARTAQRDSPCTSCERPSSPWRPCRQRSRSPARD